MSSLIEPAQIVHENSLVWIEDVSGLDYVRQHLDRTPWRSKKPAFHRDGRMIGYAVLNKEARSSRVSGTFLRRVFWLAPHDRDTDPDGIYKSGAPGEAIDPRSLAPRAKGYKTERSEGGPASDAMLELGITLPSH